MAPATALDAFCCVEETEYLDFADPLWGTLWHASFLVSPGMEGFQDTPDVGAGIHTCTVWPGGQVGVASRLAPHKEDLSGLL